MTLYFGTANLIKVHFTAIHQKRVWWCNDGSMYNIHMLASMKYMYCTAQLWVDI